MNRNFTNPKKDYIMIRLILAFLAAIFSLIVVSFVIHLAGQALDSVTQQGAQAQAFIASQTKN
ncbi:MAG: hypothetical protein ACOY44_07785 [Pseudomonadota bacterium]